MLGWHLVHDSVTALRTQLTETRIASLAAELKTWKEYAAKCERLLDHERERIDAERERADRIADSLFQANGLPATSVTVVGEQKAADAEAALKRTDYMAQLLEIYGETEEDMQEEAEPVEPAEITK